VAEPTSVSVVIPALNEAESVGDVVRRLRAAGSWHEILVIDDGSTDATAEEARAAGAMVIRHPYTKGNGAATKTGLRAATGQFVLVCDADGQHPPEEACRIVARLGEFDLVVGARSPATHATWVRRWGNGLLNLLASYLTGMRIPDLTCGFRAARLTCLREFQHLLPNGFSTPTTTTLAFVKAGYNVVFEPFDARRGTGSSKMNLAREGARFVLILAKVVTLFSPMRIFLPISTGTFLLGAGYGVAEMWAGGRIPNGAVLLILFSALAFLVGLVSEQIASIRFGGEPR
jgi:glycosyltransferase involved in cell wall biosynthesis